MHFFILLKEILYIKNKKANTKAIIVHSATIINISNLLKYISLKYTKSDENIKEMLLPIIPG